MYLSVKYNMTDPLQCLASDPPSRGEYKEYVIIKITSFYERELREAASTNSCMEYLHVGVTGLRGKHHPAIAFIKTTSEVAKMRPHLKMLCGNLLTYGVKFEQSGVGSPHCRLCDSPFESVTHLVSTCTTFTDVREQILIEIDEKLKDSKNCLRLSNFQTSEETLTQFLLDPTSMNLIERVHMTDPIVTDLFKLSRDLCYHINKRRMNLLQDMKDKKSC